MDQESGDSIPEKPPLTQESNDGGKNKFFYTKRTHLLDLIIGINYLVIIGLIVFMVMSVLVSIILAVKLMIAAIILAWINDGLRKMDNTARIIAIVLLIIAFLNNLLIPNDLTFIIFIIPFYILAFDSSTASLFE